MGNKFEKEMAEFCDPELDICPDIQNVEEVGGVVDPILPPDEHLGAYIGWLVAPMIQMIGASVTAYDVWHTDTTACKTASGNSSYVSPYTYTYAFGYFSSLSYFSWYHEMLRNGPRYEDKVFDHSNGTMQVLLLAQIGVVAFAQYTT